MLPEERGPLLVEQRRRSSGSCRRRAAPAAGSRSASSTERRKNSTPISVGSPPCQAIVTSRHARVRLDQLPHVRLEQVVRHPEARARVEHLLREEEAVRAVEVADRARSASRAGGTPAARRCSVPERSAHRLSPRSSSGRAPVPAAALVPGRAPATRPCLRRGSGRGAAPPPRAGEEEEDERRAEQHGDDPGDVGPLVALRGTRSSRRRRSGPGRTAGSSDAVSAALENDLVSSLWTWVADLSPEAVMAAPAAAA